MNINKDKMKGINTITFNGKVHHEFEKEKGWVWKKGREGGISKI